mmetsp:Transcript_25720/g.75885  ORF Transcript_25720/g.75885 Transcript_25720/m.75885 type:complete len:312 (-) Transcript_25720:1197-2132(-)
MFLVALLKAAPQFARIAGGILEEPARQQRLFMDLMPPPQWPRVVFRPCVHRGTRAGAGAKGTARSDGARLVQKVQGPRVVAAVLVVGCGVSVSIAISLVAAAGAAAAAAVAIVVVVVGAGSPHGDPSLGLRLGGSSSGPSIRVPHSVAALLAAADALGRASSLCRRLQTLVGGSCTGSVVGDVGVIVLVVRGGMIRVTVAAALCRGRHRRVLRAEGDKGAFDRLRRGLGRYHRVHFNVIHHLFVSSYSSLSFPVDPRSCVVSSFVLVSVSVLLSSSPLEIWSVRQIRGMKKAKEAPLCPVLSCVGNSVAAA